MNLDNYRKLQFKPLLLTAFLLTSFPQGALAQLVNDGFETGDGTGWTTPTEVIADFDPIAVGGGGFGVTPSLSFERLNISAGAFPDVLVDSDFSWTHLANAGLMGVIRPVGDSTTFDNTLVAIGMSPTERDSLVQRLADDAASSGFGLGDPTNAAAIYQTVSLAAGQTITLAWNYQSTDYVPFNDGSIAFLINETDPANVGVVNNRTGEYALLGFTNPGTGDYSTGTYGSTGWQSATFQASSTGDYTLGFAVFNLEDTALGPVLMIDNPPGTTELNSEPFGAVPPNEGSDAPDNSGAAVNLEPTPVPTMPLFGLLILVSLLGFWGARRVKQ